LSRRCRNGIRQFQHQLLVGIKDIAFAVPIQVTDLLVTQSCRLTCGRVDVDSKRTFNQLGGTNLAEDFELVVHQVDLLKCLAELRIGDQKIRMGSNRFKGRNIPSQTLARKLTDQIHF
jgi:hypothetical protein